MSSKLKNYYGVIRKLAEDMSNKSVSRQVFELVIFYLRSQLGPGFYLKAQLYRSSVPFRDVLGFLSLKQYEKYVFFLNDRLYHRCSQNKAIEKAILTTYGLPTPELLGHFHKTYGVSVEGASLRTQESLAILIEKHEGSRLCFKYTEGWGGNGFRAIESLTGRMIKDLVNKRIMTFDDFFSSLSDPLQQGVVIERYLTQHPDFEKYNASSVNTCRIGVMRDKSGHVNCIYTYLRVGRDGSLVDNSTSGGVTFPIDKDTGIVQSGFTKYLRGEFYDYHPDSGVEIAGTVLPMFDEAVNLAKAALSVFPRLNFAGTDIAFSEYGPVVIEINIQPDYNDFADTSIPSRKALQS